MILISLYETTYPAPDDAEDDFCPDGETEQLMVDEPVTFTELVRLMRQHSIPSCSHPRGEPFEWLSTEPEQNYTTGEWTERTLHFSLKNTQHQRRYWRLAMQAARFIRR